MILLDKKTSEYLLAQLNAQNASYEIAFLRESKNDFKITLSIRTDKLLPVFLHKITLNPGDTFTLTSLKTSFVPS